MNTSVLPHEQKEQARSLVRDLALADKSCDDIQNALVRAGLGTAMDFDEIQVIRYEVAAGRALGGPKEHHLGVRFFGLIAVLIGVGAMSLQFGSDLHIRRFSPSGWGLIAMVFGLILLIWPKAAKFDF